MTVTSENCAVAAVVVTYRRPHLATEVVRMLVERERLAADRVVLVVNGEGGLDDARLESAVRLVRLPENGGPAAGFAEGMAVASKLEGVRWFYLCEDDVALFDLPLPRLQKLVATTEQLEPTGAPVGAVVAYGRDLKRWTGHTVVHDVDRDSGFDEVDAASWGASLVSRQVLEAGVMPDPAYFFGYEDFDFWYSVKKAGFRILLDRSAAAGVAPHMSLEGRDRAFEHRRPVDSEEPWRAFYVSRNYFRLARRHGSVFWVLAHGVYSLRRFQLASTSAERRAILHGLAAGLRGSTGRDDRYVRQIGELDGADEATRTGQRDAAPRPPRVVHAVPVDVARGVQVFARDLVNALACSGTHSIVTLFRSPPAVLPPHLELDVPMGRLRAIGFDPRVVLRLRRVLRDLDPDVIVAHGGEPLKYLVFARARGTPIVYLAVGIVADQARRGARRRLYKMLMSRVDVVAGVSTETLLEVGELFEVGPFKTALLQNARDPEVFHPPRTTKAAGVPVLAYASHLEDNKRPFLYLDAVEELLRRGHRIRAEVIGDGPLESELHMRVRAMDAVEVLGGREDVPALLRSSDVFVFTGDKAGEGMPGVLIEAAMSGLPIVTTDVPGASSVVVHGKTGYVVPEEDESALVAALERLVMDAELRHAMGSAARKWALDHFSLEQSAEHWQELLLDVARRRATGGEELVSTLSSSPPETR